MTHPADTPDADHLNPTDASQPADKASTPEPSTVRQPHLAGRLLQSLLDPQSLRVMMTTGGGMLVAGLVIWLWAVGVFEDPLVAACGLGVANLTLMAVGAGVVRYTRHATAGTAITLLACLVMPLNLWFYDAQGLITLRNGGHLWVPALGCCVLYAAVARLLRRPVFVYTLVAGVALTGLLILADQQVDRFWEVLAPSLFLVVLGSLAVHAQRLFPTTSTDFSRDRFGMAFFHAGHAVMACGLVVLLAGRLVGWLGEPFLRHVPWVELSDVTTLSNQKMAAMLLVLLASYTYGFSQLVVARNQQRWGFAALITLMWCGVILLDWLGLQLGESLLLLAVAIVAVTCRALENAWLRPSPAPHPLAVACGGPAALSTTLVTGWAVVAVARQWYVAEPSAWSFEGNVIDAAAVLLTAVSWGLVAGVYHKHNQEGGMRAALVGVGITLLAAATMLVGMWGVDPGLFLLGLLVVPLALEVLSFAKRPVWLREVELSAYLSMLLAVILATGALAGHRLVGVAAASHLDLATFFGLSAVVFNAAAIRRHRALAAVLAAGCGSIAIWQVLSELNWAEYAPLMAASVMGLLTLVAARLTAADVSSRKRLERVGISLAMLSSAGGLLMTLSRLMTGEGAWGLLALASVQGCTMSCAVVLSPGGARQPSRVLAGAHVVAAVLTVNAMAGFTFWERVEIVLVTVGVVVLASGHHRWLHEDEGQTDPLVDYDLLVGSVLAAGPLITAVLMQRFGEYTPPLGMQLAHASGSLLVGLFLLAAGLACKIRATTVVGTASLGLWMFSLVGLVHLPELENAAVQMMVGGGSLFLTAVALSVYRDRLLALPGRWRERQGVFQVLEWR